MRAFLTLALAWGFQAPEAAPPPSTGDAEEADASALLQARAEAGSSSGKLPHDANLFEQVWARNLRRALREPQELFLEKGLQVVFGVFSMAKDAAYRHTVRRTWMKQPQVCPPPARRRKDCAVHAVFALGRQKVERHAKVQDEEQLREDGALLWLLENQNMGKTLAWIQYAVEEYPWATHYGKIDQDVFPFFNNLLAWVPKVDPTACSDYLGEPTLIADTDTATCYNNLRQAGLAPTYGEDNCIYFMNGALHLTSRKLAASASKSGSFWDRHPDWGGEDCLQGLGYAEYAREAGTCIRTWWERPEGAWEHWKEWPDAGAKGKKQQLEPRVIWKNHPIHDRCFREGEPRVALFDNSTTAPRWNVTIRWKNPEKWHWKGWGTRDQDEYELFYKPWALNMVAQDSGKLGKGTTDLQGGYKKLKISDYGPRERQHERDRKIRLFGFA